MIRGEHRMEQCLSCRHVVTESAWTGDGPRPVPAACVAPPSTPEEILKGEIAGICLGWGPRAGHHD